MKKAKTETSFLKVGFCVYFSVDSSNQTAWRKANLACKLAIDNTEKDELLRGGENQSTRQRLVQFCWVNQLHTAVN